MDQIAPPQISRRTRRLAYLAWLSVCVIWGTTYFGIRISLETVPPFLMGGMRWTLAGTLLVIGLRLNGATMPQRSRWPSIALLAFLMLVLGNGGVVLAEQWVPSGLTAVLVATSPFWMAGIEACLPGGERLKARVIAGLVIGFSGIVFLVWPDLTLGSAGNRGFLVGILCVQVAALGWSLGSSYSKRHARDENILATTAYQMLAGGMMMLLIGTARSEWATLSFSARTALALTYLTTIGSAGGFVAYAYALRHLPVSFVSLYAYINPIIAVTLGVLFLHEPFTARMALAVALVFAGVAVVRWERQPAKSPEESRSSPASTADAGERSH